jgi:hypothetical protein
VAGSLDRRPSACARRAPFDTETDLGQWQESSVSEDNIPVRDGVGMPGEEGLRAFIADLDPLEAAELPPDDVLAAQIGHFLIRGSSRESAYVRVLEEEDSPRSERSGDGWVHRAVFQRDGYRQAVTVRVGRDGDVSVERS